MTPKNIVKISVRILAAFALIAGAYTFIGSSTADEMNKTGMDAGMGKNMDGLAVATFAGGCFWCTESDFEKVDGVKDAVSGYTGGHTEHPSYAEVSAGTTGHTEAVQVYYDPEIVTYEQLLDVFWRHINPTDSGGQFVDRGSQYRPEIFYHNDTQKRLAEASKANLEKSMVFEKPIVTPVTRLETFYPAEKYHQDYYKKSPLKYKYYRWGSGRDQFIEKAWKDQPMEKGTDMSTKTDMETASADKMDPQMAGMADMMERTMWKRPDESEIRSRLTPIQYRVTQEDGTEPPFKNEYWNNKKDGIYVDIVSGEPLFSSRDKFVSGTGWPSFTRPLEPDHVVEKEDRKLFMVRTEVRSRHGDSHLGHVFDDGPAPTGLRYCINSASLRFIPKESLESEGYGRYASLF